MHFILRYLGTVAAIMLTMRIVPGIVALNGWEAISSGASVVRSCHAYPAYPHDPYAADHYRHVRLVRVRLERASFLRAHGNRSRFRY